jgi:hypothetical protein
MTPFLESASNDSDPTSILAELRALAPENWADDVSLTSLAGNPLRQDHRDRRTYLVCRRGITFAHLTEGRDLSALWQKNAALSTALPDLVASPYFHKQGHHRDFFAREFVAGCTLSDGVTQGKITPEKAYSLAVETMACLRKTARTSTVEAAQAESIEILKKTALLSECALIDRAFFRDVITPLVLQGIALSTPKLCWTNGDFIPRNLILDESGRVRLIDYEFASQTHFPDDEWRWNTFGDLGPIPRFSHPIPPWLEVLFWCRQLLLSEATINSSKAVSDREHAFEEITSLLRKDMAVWSSSFFLRRLSPAKPKEKEIARLQAAEAALTDKLNRTLASRSWRYTAWLRALRRLFTRHSAN